MMGSNLVDLGDLLVGITVTSTLLMFVCAIAQRRRDAKRERLLLDAIEREYRSYFQITGS